MCPPISLCFLHMCSPTVRVLTSVKRTSSSDRSVKTYSKRVHHNESQSSLTHIGAPVNPITAKALATKLNERHNQMNRVENRPEPVTLANDSPTKCGRTALTKVKVEPQQNGIKAELESNKNENGTLQKFNAAELVCVEFGTLVVDIVIWTNFFGFFSASL